MNGMNLTSENLLCPHCNEPLTCSLVTTVRIEKHNLRLTTKGVVLDIDGTADDCDSSNGIPMMYSDEYCVLLGYYGKVEERYGTFARHIKCIRCPKCGELKNYHVYEDKDGHSSLVTDEEYKNLIKKYYKPYRESNIVCEYCGESNNIKSAYCGKCGCKLRRNR